MVLANTTIIGTLGQKGGVGKSTTARALAYEASRSGLKVKVADLDIQQGTFSNWHQKRLQNGKKGIASVSIYPNVKSALEDTQEKGYDMLILDDRGHASQNTMDIAKVSDFVLLPSGVADDDIDPTLLLAKTLEKKGIRKEKFIITLSRVSSESTANEAREKFADRGYTVCEGYIEEKPSFVRSHNNGLTILETPYKSVNDKAQHFIDSLVDIITQD